MIGTHKDIKQTVCLDGQCHELLAQIARMEGVSMSEANRRAIRLLAGQLDILPPPHPHWAAGPATRVALSHQQPVMVRESTAAEIAETDALKAETMAALLGLPAHS